MLPKWYRYSSREITSFWLCSTYGQRLLMLISYCSYYKYHTFTNIQNVPRYTATEWKHQTQQPFVLVWDCEIMNTEMSGGQVQLDGVCPARSLRPLAPFIWRASGCCWCEHLASICSEDCPCCPYSTSGHTHTSVTHLQRLWSYDHITTVCVSWERRSCCSCTTGWEMWPKPHLWNIRCMV